MKILFLHLSDLHIENENDVDINQIRKMADALSPQCFDKVDQIFILVTGDLAYSGKKEQYSYFDCLKKQLLLSLKEKVLNRNDDKSIHFFIVPGNHDIDYTSSKFDRTHIENTIYKDSGRELDKYL